MHAYTNLPLLLALSLWCCLLLLTCCAVIVVFKNVTSLQHDWLIFERECGLSGITDFPSGEVIGCVVLCCVVNIKLLDIIA